MLMILRISPRNCSNSCSTFNRSSAPIHLRHRVPLLRESSIKTRDKRVVKAGETFGGFEHFNSVETEIRGEREREIHEDGEFESRTALYHDEQERCLLRSEGQSSPGCSINSIG